MPYIYDMNDPNIKQKSFTLWGWLKYQYNDFWEEYEKQKKRLAIELPIKREARRLEALRKENLRIEEEANKITIEIETYFFW